LIFPSNNLYNIIFSLEEESNEKKEEMIAKFLRHRKILMSNCEQAEQEIRRVDEIYHDTINYVLEVSA